MTRRISWAYCILLSAHCAISVGVERDGFIGVEPLKDAWKQLDREFWAPDPESIRHLRITPSNRESVLDIVYSDEGEGSADLIITDSKHSQLEELLLPLTGTNTLRVRSVRVVPHHESIYAEFTNSKGIKVKKIAVSHHGRNTFFPPPDRIRAVKFDPWCSKPGWGELNPSKLVPFWKDRGFNAIFMIVQNRTGAICFPSEIQPDRVDRDIVSKDFVRRLMEEADKAGMVVSAGVWGGRDDPLWEIHPEWREKTTPEGRDGGEKILCPNSPYYDEYLIPLFKEIHQKYGIESFWLQEFWHEWIGYMKRGCYCSYCMKKSGGNPTTEFYVESLLDVIKKLQWEIGESAILIWENPFEGDVDVLKKMGLGIPYVDYFTKQTLYPDQMVFQGYMEEPKPEWTFPWILGPGYAEAERCMKYFQSPPQLRDMLIMVYGGRGIRFRSKGCKEVEDFYLALKTLGITRWAYEYDAWPASEGPEGPVWQGISRSMQDWESRLSDCEYMNPSPKWLVAPSDRQILSAVWRSKDGSYYGILGNLSQDGIWKEGINTGSEGDSIGPNRIQRESWGEAHQDANHAYRITLADGQHVPTFYLTVPEESSVEIGIEYLDEGTGEILLGLNAWNGGSWLDQRLGTLRFLNTGKRNLWNIDVSKSGMAQARDVFSMPGKQVCFQFWNPDGSCLSQALAVARIALMGSSFETDTRNEVAIFRVSDNNTWKIKDLREEKEIPGSDISVDPDSVCFVRLVPRH